MDDPTIAAAVAYRARTRDAPAQCAVMVLVVERGELSVVESSTELLDCGAAPSADSLADATELEVEAERIGLFQQHTRRNSQIELVRRADGRWVVASARFTFPEYDEENDEMRVFTESVEYAPGAETLLASEFRHEKIAPHLERQEVE